jgi:hypothetical protein
MCFGLFNGRSKRYTAMTVGPGWIRVTAKGALKIRAMSSKSFGGLAIARLTSPSLQKLSNLITDLHCTAFERNDLMILNARREGK